MSLRYRLALWSLSATVFAIPMQEAIVIPGIGSAVRLLGFLAIGLTAISVVEPEGIKLRAPSLLLLVAGLYVGWTILSFYWTVDTSATQSTIVTHVQLLLFIWAIWQLSTLPTGRRYLAQAYVLGSLVAAVNVLNNFLFHSDLVNLDGRTTALGGNHNDLASVMAIALVFAWWLLSHRHVKTWTIVNAVYIPLGLFAVVLTGSRSGTVAALLALAAIPLSIGRVSTSRRTLLAIVLTAVLAAMFLLPADIRSRAIPALQRVTQTPELLGSSDLTGRTEIWKAGYLALRDNPIIGYGGDAFPQAVRYWLGFSKAAHNTFLSIAVNTGVVGLGLFCLMLAIASLNVLTRPRSASRTIEATLFGVLLVCLLPLGWEYYKVTWFVLAFLTSSLGTPGSAPLPIDYRKAA